MQVFNAVHEFLGLQVTNSKVVIAFAYFFINFQTVLKKFNGLVLLVCPHKCLCLLKDFLSFELLVFVLCFDFYNSEQLILEGAVVGVNETLVVVGVQNGEHLVLA